LKDENNGAIMTKFVGFRAKTYALRVNDANDINCTSMARKILKKSKKSNVVTKSITFDDYTQHLFDKIEMTRKQLCIRSKLHKVYTIFKTKIVLNLYDMISDIVPNSIDTLP